MQILLPHLFYNLLIFNFARMRTWNKENKVRYVYRASVSMNFSLPGFAERGLIFYNFPEFIIIIISLELKKSRTVVYIIISGIEKKQMTKQAWSYLWKCQKLILTSRWLTLFLLSFWILFYNKNNIFCVSLINLKVTKDKSI